MELIKDSKLIRGKLHFLIKWKGYPHEESTWKSADDLHNTEYLVREFYARHPSTPRRINSLHFSSLPFVTYENLITPSIPSWFPNWTQKRYCAYCGQ